MFFTTAIGTFTNIIVLDRKINLNKFKTKLYKVCSQTVSIRDQ